MVWRLGTPPPSPPTHTLLIVLKVSVRQNANTNYIDPSINEVKFSPLSAPACFCSVPYIGKMGKAI